jgi:hypothetical protein
LLAGLSPASLLRGYGQNAWQEFGHRNLLVLRLSFSWERHEYRAPNLRGLAEADESGSTCVVASSDGSVRKCAPWIIRARTKKEIECCTLDYELKARQPGVSWGDRSLAKR